MTRNDRKAFAAQIEEAGKTVNQLRLAAVEQGTPFVGGMLRAAEENILLAFNMMDDDGVQESDR